MLDQFTELKERKYAGRVLGLGMFEDGTRFAMYGITGRSPSSQARRLVEDHGGVRIEVTDDEILKKGNPALLVYDAIVPIKNGLVVSNGAQTGLIAKTAEGFDGSAGSLLFQAMIGNGQPYVVDGVDLRSYEPDEPNYTPRISGAILGEGAGIHRVRWNPGQFEFRDHHFDENGLKAGKARFICTYKGGNENPLLPHDGNTMEVALRDSHNSLGYKNELLDAFYHSLKGGEKSEDDFRVAAALSVIGESGLETMIKNRF